ncbi:hypothetical protein LPJ53_003253 [Coemansia erecta]|uniref:Ubiquitin-like domain-containing protein n=1 Tax=Coemansia erecta TaxID=147472 RepID=A0A9W7Y1J7_9FUNG|nr:hypothetical protein LPJ53_003253 [Coemansia erecta]
MATTNATGTAGEWLIRVKALMESGREEVFSVTTKPDDTVGAFRIKLAASSQVEPRKQRLIFSGRVLTSDNAKLSDIGLSNGSALHMVTRPQASAAASGSAPTSEPASHSSRQDRAQAAGQSPFAALMGQSLQGMRTGFPGGITLTFEIDDPVSIRPFQMPPPPPPPPTMTAAAQQQQHQQQQSQTRQQQSQQNTEQQQGQIFNHIHHILDSQIRRLNQARNQHMQVMRSTVSSMFRDFGHDDGGRWLALVPERGYIPVDREVNPGSPLTAEELRRDPVPLLESPVQSPNSAYASIHGLGRIRDTAHPNDSASYRSGGLPSRAQANELVHNLVDHVLPNIRRLPGRSAFGYHTGTPEYISQNTANPIETAGAGLAGLGDAFVEVGRALQTIGGQWQGANVSDAEPAYTPEDMLSVLESISELISATSVATPFLRSIPTRQTSNTTETWEGFNGATDGDESRNARESARRHSYLISSMFQRNYRRLAQSLLMLSSSRVSEDQSHQVDEPPSSPLEQALRSLQNSLSILNSTVDRAAFLGGSPQQQQQQQQQQQPPNQREDNATRLQHYLNRAMDRRSQRRRLRQHQQYAANANIATVPTVPVSSSSDTSNTTATTASATTPSTAGTGSEDDALRNIVSRIEAGFSRMLQGQSADFTDGNRVEIEVEAISLPTIGFQIINPPNQTHPTSQARNPGSEGAPTNAAASVASEAPDSPTVTTPRSGSPDSSVFGFIDRIGGMGSQTARSDRSNFSTTTEYSTNNGQSTRIPRILAFTGGLGQPSAFSSGTNPFPFASVFLGTESNSSTTTRRASISSAAGRAAGNENLSAGTDSETSSSVAAAATEATADSAAVASASDTEQRQSGTVRPRSVSFVNASHGDDYDGGADSAGGSYTRGTRGSSKRHKHRGDDGDGEDRDGSDDGEDGASGSR